MLRVTLVVLWCVMGSCKALSPGARAVLSLTTQVSTPKSALCCPGLKIFSPDIARTSSSITELHERGGTRVRLKVTETRDGGGSVRKKSSRRVADREPQGETVGKREKGGCEMCLVRAQSIKYTILCITKKSVCLLLRHYCNNVHANCAMFLGNCTMFQCFICTKTDIHGSKNLQNFFSFLKKY